MALRFERGDTLVEVIFAIALISVVMVSAFNIIGESYRVGMLAKERTEAVSLAQQQVERLRIVRDRKMQEGDMPLFDAEFPGNDQMLKADFSLENCPATGCTPEGDPNSIYHIFVSVPPNAIAGLGSTLRTYNIRVEWIRAGTGDLNQTTVDFRLSDRRVQQRDCSVVESCS